MKKNLLKSIFVIAIITLLSGCVAFHSGNLWDSALLNSANFSYVKQDISGNASATYVFGIGGLSKTALVGLAKKNMIINNPLEKNQALVNLSVNFKNSYYFGIVIIVNCTVTADVVEFNNGQLILSNNTNNTNNNINTQNSIVATQAKTNITIIPVYATFTDPRDNRTYKTVKIGTQTWMAENFAFKVDSGCWAYDNNEKNIAIYGYLYDWKTAKAYCPVGWHLPKDIEWNKLIDAFNGIDLAAIMLRNATGWKSFKFKNINNQDINISGFSALPGGYRRTNGDFKLIEKSGIWWSSTDLNSTSAKIFGVNYDINNVSVLENDKNEAFSVRYIKD